ncbi:MAG: hypothetical protein R3C14_39765 [Caldilineaceae bacterium]
MDIIPSLDGAELLVRLVGEGQIGDTTFAEVLVGGTGHMLSWTDTLSDNVVTAVVPGVTPGVSIAGDVEITTTANPLIQRVTFYRAYVPIPNDQTIRLPEHDLEIDLVSTDTLTTATYILIMPSFGPPGALPADHCLLSATYNVRAAGGLPTANRPMNLRLYYDANSLGDLSLHNLSILAWNESIQRWEDLGGQLGINGSYLALATPTFTTYALMGAPHWRDEFDDVDGLLYPDEVENITIGGPPQNRTLTLAALTTTGFAISRPITPTVANAQWAMLTYSATANPPTTTLTIDLLSADGTLLRTGLSDGASLAEIDATYFPALKLRVNMTTTVTGETPSLSMWQLAWRSGTSTNYLPLIAK